MDDWLDRLADTLGVARLEEARQTELLEAAREVAHGVERRVTPLAAFLLGRATQARNGDLDSALADLRATIG